MSACRPARARDSHCRQPFRSDRSCAHLGCFCQNSKHYSRQYLRVLNNEISDCLLSICTFAPTERWHGPDPSVSPRTPQGVKFLGNHTRLSSTMLASGRWTLRDCAFDGYYTPDKDVLKDEVANFSWKLKQTRYVRLSMSAVLFHDA